MSFVRWLLWEGGWFWVGLFSCFVFVVFPLGLESILDRRDGGSGVRVSDAAGSPPTWVGTGPGSSSVAASVPGRRRARPDTDPIAPGGVGTGDPLMLASVARRIP